METAMEDAFVGWFNTFECKSHPIDTITELSDGIMLSDVLTDVDGKWFKQIPNDTHLTWVQRLHNQALIYKLIRHYFEQVLGQDPGLLPTVNLEAIAKNADLHELLVMCQLVIAIAVQSDNNRMYIEMIQNLPQKNQQVLMVSIEKVMRHFDGDDMNPQFSQINGLTASRNFYTDSDLLLASQFENVLTVRKQLKQSHIQLLVTYNDLRTRFAIVLDEKVNLERRLMNMDSAITQANDTGKPDLVMRAELDHLKLDLAKSEDKQHEMQQLLDQHVRSIHELERKIDDFTLQSSETEQLHDRLEDYSRTLERLGMVEDEVDKYKQKAEETGDLRRYIKALEEQNTSLLERSHQVEHEYRKVLAFKTLMDSYRQQVQQLESTNMEIQKETDRLDAQVASLTDQSNYLEGERDRNIEQLQLLEDYIKELELVGTGVTLDKVLMTDEPMELHMQDKIEDNLMETNVTELRLTIGRLKRQIKDMETNGAFEQDPPPSTSCTLQELQYTNELLEMEHKNTLAERDQLRQELVKIRNGIPGSLSDQGQSVVVFRSHLLDLKKEATYLKIQTARLETKVTQGTSSVAKDPVTFQQYKVELGRIQDQLDRLVNITKIQYHDTNRMLVEANYLDGINNQSSNNGNELGLSNNDLKTIQEQTADLQTHLIHLQEDINIIQGSTWKVRDMIKLYGLLLQEMAARFALCQDSEEPSYLVSSTPRSKEEEQNLIKKQIHGVRLQSKKEQQLIISSWYDLVHKNHREMTGLSIRSTPSSWLGRQRKLLDSHLRQKVC